MEFLRQMPLSNIFCVQVAILGLISLKLNIVGSQNTIFNVSSGNTKKKFKYFDTIPKTDYKKGIIQNTILQTVPNQVLLIQHAVLDY